LLVRMLDMDMDGTRWREAEENERVGWPASSSHISAKCLFINMYINGYRTLS